MKTRTSAFVILVSFLDMTEIKTKSFTATSSFHLIDNLNNAKFSLTQLTSRVMIKFDFETWIVDVDKLSTINLSVYIRDHIKTSLCV